LRRTPFAPELTARDRLASVSWLRVSLAIHLSGCLTLAQTPNFVHPEKLNRADLSGMKSIQLF
jgi:hypothetical protein